jgi:hypothetical protein
MRSKNTVWGSAPMSSRVAAIIGIAVLLIATTIDPLYYLLIMKLSDPNPPNS